MERSFPASKGSPPGNANRAVDRNNPWRPSPKRPERVSQNTEKNSPRKTTQKESETQGCQKDKNVHKIEEIKGLYVLFRVFYGMFRVIKQPQNLELS